MNLVKIPLGVPHKIILHAMASCVNVFCNKGPQLPAKYKNMAYDHYIIWVKISKNKEANRNFFITNILKFKLEPQFSVLLQHHCFHFFFSVLLLPTGLTVGAKHLPKHEALCFLFSALISPAKKFARLLKSSCALSVKRTAHYRDSTKAVSMPR